MKEVTSAELRLDLDAYRRAGGNRSEAARQRGLKRNTFNDRLKMAEKRFGIRVGKVADGSLHEAITKRRPLPRRGHVRRYVLTSIQNNTHLHPAFDNLLALVDWLDGLDKADCELLIGTYTYNKSKYGDKSVKRGSLKGDESEPLWYAPPAEPFLVDESVQLAPGLIWCGEQNILPTNRYPLNGLEDYNGRASNIVPHAKIALSSVPSLPDEGSRTTTARLSSRLTGAAIGG